MGNLIDRLQQRATEGKGVTAGEALDLLEKGADTPFSVMAATRIREAFKGKTVSFCGISNAKSGQCSEDCAFCAQSIHHRTDIPTYPLKTPGRIAAEAQAAGRYGGKETNLRQLLPLGLVAGANSLMTGNDLTTSGRDSGLDMEMVLDLGHTPTREARPLCACETRGKTGPLASRPRTGRNGP